MLINNCYYGLKDDYPIKVLEIVLFYCPEMKDLNKTGLNLFNL